MNRIDVIETLNKLMIVLQKFKWVKNLDSIFKAKVPILKLEMDPTIHYDCLVDRNDQKFIEMYGIDDLDVKQNSLGLNSINIKVDISVDLLNNIFEN